MTYLWLQQGEAPWELTSYVLRRDVYHCLPEELDQAEWSGIAADIAVRNALARISKLTR